MRIFTRVLTATIMIGASVGALAVNVRGRVDIRGSLGVTPMGEAIVALCTPSGQCSQFRTGYDGIYYLSVSPGSYAIVVNGVPRANIEIPNVSTFDIAPILVQ